MPKNILIAGGGLVNKGAEAMVRCVQHGILPRIGDATGSLATSVDYPEDQLQGLSNWYNPFGSRLKCIQFALLQSLGLLAHWPFRSALGRYARTDAGARIDAVIDISGYSYHDRFSSQRGKIRQLVSAHRVGTWDIFPLLGIPVFYMPQAWGPFNTPEGRLLGDRVVRGASMVFARDAHSYQCLRELPSFCDTKVRMASDIAFTFRGAPASVGQGLLDEFGCAPDGSPLIGLIPNMRVYERTPHQGTNNVYVRCLCTVADYFVQEHSARVVLMPHEIRSRGGAALDDRYLCQVVSQGVAQPERVVAAMGEYSAEQLKSMIGQMDLVISSRFHSIIAALSLRRPVIAVSWSHKYPELLRSVGLGEFVYPHEDLEPGTLVDLCARMWAERQHITALLEQHVPDHERSAESAIHSVADMIRDGQQT